MAPPRRSHGDRNATYHAKRAELVSRLVTDAHVDAGDAEHLVATWEREAQASRREDASQAFWDDAWSWIDGHRNPPKTDMDAEGADGQVYGG